MATRTVAVLLALWVQASTDGPNWPQWRGPAGGGVSPASGLPERWSRQESVKWRAKLAGIGTSSPIVWGNRVFVTSQVGAAPLRAGDHPGLAREKPDLLTRERPLGGARAEAASRAWLVIEAFDAGTGRRLWERRVEARGPLPQLHENHNLATPTPATDGERLYAWFGTGQLLALDPGGRIAWSRHLGREFAAFDVPWGHGSSPVLYRDTLILLCDHGAESYIVALDKGTGRERWKVDRGAGPASYSTPVLVASSSGDELVVNSNNRVEGYSPATGKLLWYTDVPRQTTVPSPVAHGDMIYLTRGYRGSPYMAIQSGGRGDVTATHVTWRQPSGASYTSSLVLYDGLLYMTNDIGVLTCADAKTGERVWQLRLDGLFFASPVAADGKVYLASQTGETFVVRAGREPMLVATNDLGERLVASPAVAWGRLFLRSDGALFAIERATQERRRRPE